MSNLAARFPVQPDDRVALIIGERRITYGELGQMTGSVRGGFAAAGLEPGHRVMMIGGNSEIALVTYLACLSSGLVTVPINPLSPPSEMNSEIERCQPHAVVLDDLGFDAWQRLEPDAQARAPIVLAPPGPGASHPLVDAPWVPGVEVAADEPAVLLFTSGTAGTPRPAILTHRNLAASMDAVLSLALPLAGHDHVVLAVVPLFHVFGLNLVVNLGLTIGATLVLEDHHGPERTAQLAALHGVTVVSGPPTLWASLLASASVPDNAFDTVQFAVSGAAPLDPSVARAIGDRFGLTICEGYGLTETSGLVCSALGLDTTFGSVGRPFPGVEVRLVDQAGDDVLIGDAGEVLVRGPMVSPGYFGDDIATARTRTDDDWLITGDLAVVDDGGELAIVGRAKDLIIVSGFNVHPAEIERVIAGHEAVDLVAVVAEPDELTGEHPVAHVVLHPGSSVSEAELIGLCHDHLARYKTPKAIVFTNSIPTGLGGKLRRSALGAASSSGST